MLFKELVAVYSENPTEHINTHFGNTAKLQIVGAVCTYSYNWAVKG